MGVTMYGCLSQLVCVCCGARVAAVCAWVRSLFIAVVACGCVLALDNGVALAV